MTIRKNKLPNIAQKDADLILLSEWTGKESNLIKSMNLSMDEVESTEWPNGLISYSCFLSNEKNRVLHCVQWESQEHHLNYVENHLPERLETLKDEIKVEAEKSFGRFKVKESKTDKTDFDAEFVGIAIKGQTLALKNKPEHISEYVLQNIDNGNSMLYAELAELNGELLSNSDTTFYSLYRSYVRD